MFLSLCNYILDTYVVASYYYGFDHLLKASCLATSVVMSIEVQQ